VNPPFRFVIVGSGNISRTYLKAIANLPGVEVAGVVSRSGRRPEGLPVDAGVFPTLAAVDVPFDAVILTTPNGLHHQGTLEAAALGKHVLTEKVLEISTDAMDRMIRACRDAGVKLAVTYQRRMSPDNVAVKRLLDAGAFGRVFAADMAVKFWRDAAYYRSGAYRGTRPWTAAGPSRSRPRTMPICSAGSSGCRTRSLAFVTVSCMTSRSRTTVSRCCAIQAA